MKKIYALIPVFAVLLAGCAKEAEVVVEQPSSEKFVISATVPSETKTIVDGINLKWADGDKLTVFDSEMSVHTFELEEGAGENTGTFGGSLSGATLGDYALYPQHANNGKGDGASLIVVYPDSYSYENAPTPLLGTKTAGSDFGFQHVGGAIRIQYKNAPASASTFEFEATSSGYICGNYKITDPASGISGSIAAGTKKVTITDLPGTADLEFVIPVPAGAHAFTVKLKDAKGNVVNASEKTVGSAKSIAVGHILNLGAIVLPTAVTVTKSLSELCTDSDDGLVVTPLDLNGDGIISIDQAGNGNNGKYYKSDHSLRYYTGGGAMTISLTGSYTLQKVNVTFSGALTGLTSGSDVEATGTSVSYACTSNAKVTSISVTYSSTTNTVESSKVPTPVITDSENVVTISCALDGATIYYTLNGSTPSSDSILYEGPFEINEDVSVKAIAYKSGYGDSEVSSAHDIDYNASLVCGNPTISCTNNYVTITSTTPGVTFRYTTDGSTNPSKTVGTVYSAPFLIAEDTEVRAIAYKLGYTNSSVITANCNYENVLATPANVEVTDIVTGTSISLKWNSVTNATGYSWIISTKNNYNEAKDNVFASGTTDGTIVTKTSISPVAGTVYYAYVQATDNTSTYDPSSWGVGHAILYQHPFTAKPSTGNDVTLSTIKWDITATNLGSYNSGNYAGVQLGSSSSNGSISLTSSNNWGAQSSTSYYGYGTVKKVNVWANLGGTSVTPSVTIGGTSASKTGSVSKNSSAGTDWTKTSKVVFTPGTNSSSEVVNTGVVVINLSSVKAGYICCIEILSE